MGLERSKNGYQLINGYVFDVYIFNVDEDDKWVIEQLLLDIDFGELIKDYGDFKLYFKVCDVIFGKCDFYNILVNIKVSKKVIIVLIEEYIFSDLY